MPKTERIEQSIPDGAGFELLKNSGFKSRTFCSKLYLYSPSKPFMDFDMSANLNSAIFVYSDKPYTSKAEAWNILANTGLLEIAEEKAAYIIMPLPVKGKTWSESDVAAFYDIQFALAGGDNYVPRSRNSAGLAEYKKLIFNNHQYVIAEGSGAAFVNNYLSQHAGSIAGVLTFGGHIDDNMPASTALPAYLVNADNAVISYYKKVNGTDAEATRGVFINSGYPLKKVIVAEGGNTFNAGLIADAWSRLFGRTARICCLDNIMFNPKGRYEKILMSRPDYKELGIKRIDHRNEKLPDGTTTIWYDFVPDGVLADPKTRVPLVIVLHGGGDDPIYQAESNGWVAKAVEKGFVVISPHYPSPLEINGADKAENIVLNILEYALKTYPIDERRVYLTGFSMGGMTTGLIGLRNANKFAAITTMGSSGYADEKTRDMVDSQKDKIQLPFAMIAGTNDVSFGIDQNGNVGLGGEMFWGEEALRQLLKINGMETPGPDYAKFPYWGYPTEDSEIIVDKNLRYRVSYVKNRGDHIAKFVLFENAYHSHCDYFATIAWDFMSRFMRQD